MYVFMHSIPERTVILHDALVSLSLSVSLHPENGSPGVTGILKGARPGSQVAVGLAQNKE